MDASPRGLISNKRSRYRPSRWRRSFAPRLPDAPVIKTSFALFNFAPLRFRADLKLFVILRAFVPSWWIGPVVYHEDAKNRQLFAPHLKSRISNLKFQL